MNADDTRALLRDRRELTNDAFSEGTVLVWTAALAAWTLAEARGALIRAAREHPRVGIAHVVNLLPHRAPPEPDLPPIHCELCDDTGARPVSRERAHRPQVCTGDPCYCTAVEPCICSRGLERRDAFARARDHNDRVLAPHRHTATPPPWKAEQELPL